MAYRDPVILEDNRVFQNMLDIEEFYVAATNYFQNKQSEIKPHMRKIVTDWMLEVGILKFLYSVQCNYCWRENSSLISCKYIILGNVHMFSGLVSAYLGSEDVFCVGTYMF